MRLPFRFRAERQIAVRLHVDLGFQYGRLADLVQFLARSTATITDLKVDRALYDVGMPERFAEVTTLVTGPAHRVRILEALADKGFIRRFLDSRAL